MDGSWMCLVRLWHSGLRKLVGMHSLIMKRCAARITQCTWLFYQADVASIAYKLQDERLFTTLVTLCPICSSCSLSCVIYGWKWTQGVWAHARKWRPTRSWH